MDLVFLGGLFPRNLESEIIKRSIGRIDFAANNLQYSFIKGLEFHNKKSVTLLNCPYIGAFPTGYRKMYIKTEKFSHLPNASDINIGFCNLVGIRFLSRLVNAFKHIRKWANDNGNERKVLIIYAMHSPFLLSAVFAKIKNPNIRLCLIIPDLPEYMSDKNNPVRRSLKYLDAKLMGFALRRIDSFVLLSDYMAEKISINDRPWVRIEGIFDDNTAPESPVEMRSGDRIIMYSGNLDLSQGIGELISAFSQIKYTNYKLWITGHGNGLALIVEAAKEDNRISYFERLSRENLLAKQRKATILINPLKTGNPKVKYFFPSKTMEYLASGRVTLMYKLPSIPKEYDDYLYFFDDDSVDSMKDKIIEISEKSELELSSFGDAARVFILKYKTPEVQCEKLYNMLLKL